MKHRVLALGFPVISALSSAVAEPGCSDESGHPSVRHYASPPTPGDAARSTPASASVPEDEWPAYGRTVEGARHSPLSQIDRDNVQRLKVAWTFHTSDISDGTLYRRRSTFQATPIHVFGALYLITPFNRVFALDPETGQQRWVYDPGIDKTLTFGHGFAARGVSEWHDRVAAPGGSCRRRILFGTLDARLIALDADAGTPCSDFGHQGVVDLADGIAPIERGQYGVSSPPAVVGDVVIVGSSIGDNRSIDSEEGTVRAFDVRTGALRWSCVTAGVAFPIAIG
jgi:quinoprotein glucose dehydrogenase